MKLRDMTPLNGAAGADCIHTSVFNVLKFNGYTNYERVWKQCGLIYTKVSKNEPGILRGKYMNFVDELYWIHRIRLIPIYTKNNDEFINGIINNLDNGQPVLVHVDVFNLVDNQFYRKKSSTHMITIVDYKNGLFTYIDENYIKKSTISKNDLLSASWMNRNFENQYNYFTVDLSESRLSKVSDCYDVIERNLQYLNGDVSHKNLSNLKMELYPHQPEIIIGYDAIRVFLEDYEDVFYDFNKVSESFDPLYFSFMNLSFSHNRFATYLAGHTEQNILHSTVEGLKAISQDWKVASNMLIKALYKKDINMIDRLILKVKKLKKDQVNLIQDINFMKEKYYG